MRQSTRIYPGLPICDTGPSTGTNPAASQVHGDPEALRWYPLSKTAARTLLDLAGEKARHAFSHHLPYKIYVRGGSGASPASRQ